MRHKEKKNKLVNPSLKTYCLFVDGSCLPNPNGNVGIGVYINEVINLQLKYPGRKSIKATYDKSTNIGSFFEGYKHGTENFEETSNNVAEHMAMIRALQWINEKKSDVNDRFVIFTDSQMAACQLNKEYRINYGYAYYHFASHALKLFEETTKNVQIFWIPREMNTKADELSKMGGEYARTT